MANYIADQNKTKITDLFVMSSESKLSVKKTLYYLHTFMPYATKNY